MPFKSDAQRKLVMAILLGAKKTLTTWHGSSQPIKRLRNTNVLHSGSLPAALSAAYGQYDPSGRNLVYLYQITEKVTPRSLLMSRGLTGKTLGQKRIWTEHRAEDVTKLDSKLGSNLGMWAPVDKGNLPRRYRTLKRLGKHLVPYINTSEDVGSVSYVHLFPKGAKIKLRKKIPYAHARQLLRRFGTELR